MPQSYETILADMVTVARAAGALTQTYFERFRELEIGIKGPADFVSEADCLERFQIYLSEICLQLSALPFKVRQGFGLQAAHKGIPVRVH